jgi:hypothetical protein
VAHVYRYRQTTTLLVYFYALTMSTISPFEVSSNSTPVRSRASYSSLGKSSSSVTRSSIYLSNIIRDVIIVSALVLAVGLIVVIVFGVLYKFDLGPWASNKTSNGQHTIHTSLWKDDLHLQCIDLFVCVPEFHLRELYRHMDPR